MVSERKSLTAKLHAQYCINREAAKISALSSAKIDKYEYLAGEEISHSNQRQIIEQAKFTYSSLRKSLGKRSLGEGFYAGKVNIDKGEMDQTNLLENLAKFNNKFRPKNKEGKVKKQNTFMM